MMRFAGVLIGSVLAFANSLVVLIPAHVAGTILRIKLSVRPTTDDVELLAYSQLLRSKDDLEANKILFTALIVEPLPAPQARTHLYLVHRMQTCSRVVPLWTETTIFRHALPSPRDVIAECMQNRMNFPERIENLPEAQVLYRRKLINSCSHSL